jgi:exonuclease SbcC
VKIKDTEQQSVSKQSKNQKAQQVSSQWLILCNRLNASRSDLKVHNIGLMKQLLADENEELKNINSLLSSCERKRAAIEKTKAALIKSDALVRQLQLTVNELDSAWQQRSQEQAHIAQQLQNLQQAEQAQLQQLTAQLSQLGEALPETGQEDALIARLNARRHDYKSYITRAGSFDEDMLLLQNKQAACQVEMSRYDSQFAQLNERVQREESIGLQIAVIEKQQQINEKHIAIAEQRQNHTALEQSVQAKISASRFVTYDALQDTLKRLESLPQLQKRYDEQQADLVKKTTALTSLQEQLSVAQSDEQLAALNFDDINEQLKRVNEQLDIAKLESRRLEQLVQSSEQSQRHYDTLTKQLQQQQAVTAPQREQAAQLKAETPLEQRRRLQQRMVEQLLSQANGVLEKISKRYYLRQSFSEHGLALIIEDTYQANSQRALKTLSGGESFIISLALALGLSEIANNGKSVDSLFLDEGFGNLDSESLYTVISTLESLHEQGKTVGVISHVDAVQQRFKTQLQVIKKPNGYSALKMVS